MNDEGVHFPIFGICMGFQLLHFLEEPSEIYEYLNSVDLNNPLDYQGDPTSSPLFRFMSRDLIIASKTQGLTYNWHRISITPKTYEKYETISSNFEIQSLSYDDKGIPFVSSTMHKNYPFYGVQWHPEVASYKWYDNVFPHDSDA